VPRVVRAARPDRAALLLAIGIAAAIFTISFGFVGGERVTLGAAPDLRVRASLLARPIRRTRVRRVAPTPSPAASESSTPSTEVPVQPGDPSAPVAPAPSSTAPSPAPAPAPAPVAPKPRPKPAAKPKPPKPPDFDDTGPPAPVKRRPGSR
jgi:outer membrane biosynthesis protein TonB